MSKERPLPVSRWIAPAAKKPWHEYVIRTKPIPLIAFCVALIVGTVIACQADLAAGVAVIVGACAAAVGNALWVELGR